MKPTEIAVAWNGLPAYGAHLIQAARERVGFAFPVIGTPPDVPIEGMEDILGDELYWVAPDVKHCWSDLGIEVPRLFVHTGWGYLHFVSLADEVRASGGLVVGMFDNCWKGNLRQWIGAWYFRLFLRRKYAEAWVPGKSGERLARRIGFRASEIRKGLYGANPTTFCNRVPINKRAKQVLFVGRLIARKGLVELVTAFEQLRSAYPEWSLVVVGNGPHEEFIRSNKSIEYYPFAQPEQIAEFMNNSRILALPSREEHWGLVVHEAALCGCGLLLTQAVGAAADLVGAQNGFLAPNTRVSALVEALETFYRLSEEQWEGVEEESLELSKNFGPQRWAEELSCISNSAKRLTLPSQI